MSSYSLASPITSLTGRSGAGGTTTLFQAIAIFAEEIAVFAYFDPEWRLLGVRQVASGCSDAVILSVRDIVADALTLDCAAVVMAHNHPSGDPSPSETDYAFTRRLARALGTVGVRLVDHLVLTHGGCESFRQLGLL